MNRPRVNPAEKSWGSNFLLFSLGGLRHLAAYGVNQFSGNYVFYSQLTYQFRVASPNGTAVNDGISARWPKPATQRSSAAHFAWAI